jgi:hypothetical protein
MTIAGFHAPAGGARRTRILGVAMALLGLCLQIAAAGLPHEPIASQAESELSLLFGEHSLCLAARGQRPPADPGKSPPEHHDFAACCPAHISPGLALLPAVAAATLVARDERADRLPSALGLNQRRLNGTPRARAPPDRS